MSSRIQANIRASFDAIGMSIAQRLLLAAVTASIEHQRRLNRSNPRPYVDPSKPGEYPRKRTGYLQASTTYYPQSPRDVLLAGFVDVGYSESGFYGEALVNRGRKGIEDTIDDMRTQLEGIVAGNGTQKG